MVFDRMRIYRGFLIAAVIGAILLCALASCSELDKSALKKAIDQKAYNTGYTQESWNEYTDAYNKAVEIYNSTSTTQSLIDEAANNLTAAYKKLTKVVDFSSLENALASYVGPEGYTEESYEPYKKAYDNARKIFESDKSVSQTEINTAISEMKRAYDNLELKLDLSEIKALIATEVNQSLYTSDSYGRYKSALDAAKELVGKENIKSLYLKMATDELRSAMQNLVTIGDTKNLSAVISEAEDYYNGIVPEGLIPEETTAADYYTISSYNDLGEIIEKAKNAVLSNDIGDADIATLIDDLRSAISALSARPDITPLLEAISIASAYNSQYYTSASYLVLENAIIRANNLLETPEPTANEIEVCKKDILDAIDSLVILRVVPTGSNDYNLLSSSLATLGIDCTIKDYKDKAGELAAQILASDTENDKISSLSDEGDDGIAFFVVEYVNGLRMEISDNSILIKADPSHIGEYDLGDATICGIDLTVDFTGVISLLGAPGTYCVNDYGREQIEYNDAESGIMLSFEFAPSSDALYSIEVTY